MCARTNIYRFLKIIQFEQVRCQRNVLRCVAEDTHQEANTGNCYSNLSMNNNGHHNRNCLPPRGFVLLNIYFYMHFFVNHCTSCPSSLVFSNFHYKPGKNVDVLVCMMHFQNNLHQLCP